MFKNITQDIRADGFISPSVMNKRGSTAIIISWLNQ